MTDCVAVVRGPASMYPVFDARRTSAPAPYAYWIGFGWDIVEIDVAPDNSLSACQMCIPLVSNLIRAKEIKGYNYFNNSWTGDDLGTTAGFKASSVITRR